MGNICKSPFWGPFASLRNGEQMQIIGEQMQCTPSYCYENISHINERSLVSARLLVISYSLIASMHDKIEIGDLWYMNDQSPPSLDQSPQKVTKDPQKSSKVPKRRKKSPKSPKVTKSHQKSPKVTKSHQKSPKVTKRSSKVIKNGQHCSRSQLSWSQMYVKPTTDFFTSFSSLVRYNKNIPGLNWHSEHMATW